MKNEISLKILQTLDENLGKMGKDKLYLLYPKKTHVTALMIGLKPYIYLDKDIYHLSKNGLTLLVKNSIPVKTDITTLQDYEKTKEISLSFIPTKNEIKKCIYAIEHRKNVLITGLTGCGKSQLIEDLAKYYGKKLITLSCDIDLDKNDLLGHYEFIDNKMTWIDGIVLIAVKNGYWVVFDEINMAKQNVLSVLNSVLDFRHKITIKEHNNEEVISHKDFRVFATMNPNYNGTQEINNALRDRFETKIEMGYLSKHEETKLIEKRTGLKDKHILDKIIAIADDSRIMFNEGKISGCISTRRLIAFAEMIKTNDFTVYECAETCLSISDDKSEMHDILNIVKNYFV
jgi:MoxR-like ATPase